ncbi:MAG: hypothetical protein AABZ31_05595 [Bdellovibrionota bacterium]
MLNGLQKRLRALDKNTKLALVFVFIATVLALAFDFGSKESPGGRQLETSSQADIDTFIPSGFSLVPIEVINSNGLDSILGRFGMVDLFLENQKIAIMKNVRLIRGIRADGTWAVLVPTQFVQDLLGAGGRFLVSIRSRNNQNSEMVKKPKLRQRSITYGE